MSDYDNNLKRQHAKLDQAEYNERVKYRTKIFLRDWQEGRVKVPDTKLKDFESMIARIKFDEAGDPIVNTVDGHIRAAAMVSEHILASSEATKVSPAWIQTNVFAIIENFVESILSIPGADEQTAQTIADTLVEDDDFVKSYVPYLKDFQSSIGEFWNRNEWALNHHYIESKFSRSLFVGDVFPADALGTCCKACLFFDQVLLPDPISRVMFEISPASPDIVVLHQMIKHCISAYRLKDLVFADVAVPPVAFVPGSMVATGESGQSRLIERMSRLDAVAHINRSFGSSFADLEEYNDWSSRHDENNFLRMVQNRDQLITTYAGDTNLEQAIAENIEFYRKNMKLPPNFAMNPQNIIMMMSLGRMGQANDALMRAANYSAEPIYDVKASHQWLRWKMDLDSARESQDGSLDWKSLAASQLATTSTADTDFLTGITSAGLLKARANGALESLRQEVNETLNSFGESFQDGAKAAEAALKHLNGLVCTYNKEIEALSTREKDAKYGYASSTVPGLISMCAALTGNPHLTATAIAASTLLSGPGLISTWKEARDIAIKTGELKRSPIGVLFS